jgi:hypothetical protein
MVFKIVKVGLLGAAGLVLVGGLVFGGDLVSYVTSSARSVQASVKGSVPIEFELRRARDLLDDIIPEMHANIRLVAQQEVEIENLQREIEVAHQNLAEERNRVRNLRAALDSQQTSFTFGNFNYSRQQVTEDLGRRFGMLKEAEVVLASKQRLLENRQRALTAAMQVIDRTKSQKAMLETQIAALEGQHKLIEAAAVGSSIAVDNTKLAQTEKLIAQIRKQLDVAERVLAHESRFVEPITVEAVSERDLVAQIDEHLTTAATPASASTN